MSNAGNVCLLRMNPRHFDYCWNPPPLSEIIEFSKVLMTGLFIYICISNCFSHEFCVQYIIHPSQNIELSENSVLKAYYNAILVFSYIHVLYNMTILVLTSHIYDCHFDNWQTCNYVNINCLCKHNDLENYKIVFIFWCSKLQHFELIFNLLNTCNLHNFKNLPMLKTMRKQVNSLLDIVGFF